MRNPSQSSKHQYYYSKKVVMTRHKRILKRKNQLKNEIIELKRQLKLHPLGKIVLKARIKEKQIEIKNINCKKLLTHSYPINRKSRITGYTPFKSATDRKNRISNAL